jgi:hypothetical protein
MSERHYATHTCDGCGKHLLVHVDVPSRRRRQPKRHHCHLSLRIDMPGWTLLGDRCLPLPFVPQVGMQLLEIGEEDTKYEVYEVAWWDKEGILEVKLDDLGRDGPTPEAGTEPFGDGWKWTHIEGGLS